MMIGYCLVRRLSTRESVFTTNSVPFTTNWIWYWKDDDNKWIPYTKEESEIGSDDLEECYQYFLAGKRESTVKFTIFKHHQYVIDFKEMKQTNQIHGKKRIVRRRPHQLVTSSDVEVYNKNWKSKMQRIRVMANPKIGIKDRMLKFPSTWNNCFSELNKDVCLVEVGQDTDEYYSIEQELDAIPKKDLKVQRIHNFELWEDFYKKRTQMRAELEDRDLKEIIIWFSTVERDVTTICQQNFDISHPKIPPISFKKSASKCMAESQHSSTDIQQLFRVRMLVKEAGTKYTNKIAKCSDYRRDQLYPEYLITIRT